MNRVGFHGTHETQPSRMVYLDSVDCIHFTELTSHYTFGFKDAIETAPGEGMLVSLSSASIPYSFYNVRSGINNKLYYSVDGGGTTLSISIDPGNYSAITLGKHIADKFKEDPGPNLTVTATYDKITQKFTFGCATALSFKFTEPDTIKNEIGFGSSTALVSINPVQSQSNVSPQVADLNGSVHAIYVRTNLATKSVMESQSGGVSDILAKIDINADPGGVITLDPNRVSHEALIHTAGVKHIEIRITDERNRLLDLNGLHSQVALRFRFVDIKVSAAVAEVDPRVRVSPKDAPQLKQRRTPQSTKKKKKV